MAPEAAVPSTINLAVLRGVVSGPAELRHLPSGQRLATLAIRTHGLTPPATSVPVAVWDPPAWLDAIEPDTVLCVVGAVRRRFYRAPSGALASRVEVEAALVARATDARQVRRARRLLDTSLDEWA